MASRKTHELWGLALMRREKRSPEHEREVFQLLDAELIHDHERVPLGFASLSQAEKERRLRALDAA
jgi:hypothetical protein